MAMDALAALVSAMVGYLQVNGYSARELAHYAELPLEQLAMPATDLSPTQVQRLWQLVHSQMLPSLSFSLRVRPLIAAQLSRGRVKVEGVADQLHMSRHTLYRKLKDENQTFLGLLDDVRREQALDYLGEGSRPLAEVAELLGFSELSAFSRAFKRWMGKSPAEFRAAGC